MRYGPLGRFIIGWLPLILATGVEAGDVEDIQGVWRVASLAQGGRSAAEDQLRGADVVVTFLGDKITLGAAKETPAAPVPSLFGAPPRQQGTFRLDPSKRPKTIDIAYRFMSHDKWVHSTELGIYLLEGDTLKIHTAPPGQARPTVFPQGAANGTFLVLRRQGTPAQPGQAGPAIDPRRTPTGPDSSRDPIVGKWSWFAGGAVTIRADGTLEHDLGNGGTWERQDPARRLYSIRWRLGGFVDTVTLSEDGQSLSGMNQLGINVAARRIRDTENAPTPGAAAPRPAADPGAEPPFQRGLSLFGSGNYTAALPALLEAAGRGHPRAEALLGRMYQEGLGVPVDDRQAAHWFGQAAAQGHRAAQYALAGMYEEGEGVPKDVRKAAQLYEASARQGYDKAQFALGLSYEFGQGVERNRQTAISWLMQAAQQGDGRAHWIADWLRSPDTPRLRNEIELRNYINARMAPAPRQANGNSMPNVGAMYQKQEAVRRANEAAAGGDQNTARIIREQNRIP